MWDIESKELRRSLFRHMKGGFDMLKRAYLSLKRQPVKTITLFLIFFLLGTLTSGALVVREAIEVTEVNLYRQIPPVATILPDQEFITEYRNTNGEEPSMEVLSPSILEEIGSLPYVSMYDYGVWGDFFSSTLNLPMDLEAYEQWGVEEEDMRNIISSNLAHSMIGEELRRFTLRGVMNPEVADITHGNLDLVEGRLFTESEILNESPVVVVSSAFALTNELVVGDSISLDVRIHDRLDTPGVLDSEIIYLEHEPVIMETITLEIIGLFEPSLMIEEETSDIHVKAHVDMNTRLYTPIGVAKIPQNMWLDHLQISDPSRVPDYEGFVYQDILFVLGNPFDLTDFYEAASEILPDIWRIDDLRREFGAVTEAMIHLEGITNFIFTGVILTSVVIVSLIILLFLKDRKHEIGVYLALGEKRFKVIGQLLIEILIVTSLAVTLSLFLGYRFAETLSIEMLRTELVNNPNVMPNHDLIIGGNDFNHMGFSTQMTGEEMFEAFSVNLSTKTILTFYGYSFLLFIVGTGVPALYLLRIKPKDMLTSF